MKFETSIKTIEEIVKKDYEFIIPVYQRPYVWDYEEIWKLLGDMLSTSRNVNLDESRYFVGNTYVVKSSNKNRVNQYELIDGQQRFTTFWLIAYTFNLLDVETEMTNYLEITSNNVKDIRFDFDIRIEVANYLKGLLDNSSYLKYSDVSEKEFLKYIAEGIETIKNFITSEIKEEQRADFGNYIYKNVNFVFNIAPKNTDLNALFTALGTSGIQLQQSDILKSWLLAKVSVNSRRKYSKIWEACEDMTNYFEKNVSEIFKIDRTSIESEKFKVYDENIFSIKDNFTNSENSHQSKTISEIINSEEVAIEIGVANTNNNSKCRSIISFNSLLIHTYRIFNLQKGREDFEHTIDPKTLLSTIKLNTFSSNEDIEYFFELLWQVRYVFDKHVVKWRMEEEDNDEKLLLTGINTDNGTNSFSRTNSAYSPSQMLQSVLYFTGSQQYWLTPFLSYLLESEKLVPEQILAELEKIDNRMLPGDKKEISLKLVSQEQRDKNVDKNALEILKEPHSTSFNHYWFYKLEYLLWKTRGDWVKKDDEEKIKHFRITSKNSIEHVFPQNHEFGNKLEDTGFDWLNSFGNLGLLSVGENSSYSNQSVIKKQDDFKNKQTYDSLKLAKIYSSLGENNSWNIENIKIHQEEMIDILKEHYKILEIEKVPAQ